MPANKKYLTSSALHRILKISAGLIGGYVITIAAHLFLSLWFDKNIIMITMSFSGFILWALLLLLAFLFRNGWNAWGIYLLIALFLLIPFYWFNF